MRWLSVGLPTIVLALAAFGPVPALAATCAVPNAISNGQVADASKVMDDINAVASCAEANVAPTGSPTNGSLSVFTGPNSVTSGDLTGDVTTSGGTATTLSNTGVTPGTYSSANIIVDAKGRITFAASGAGGGGAGGGWSLIYSNSTIPNPTTSIVVDVSSYSDVMVIGRGVTAAASGWRTVQVSVDGGNTFYHTSGDYEILASTGATSANVGGLSHSTATTSAASFGGIIYGLRTDGTPKFMAQAVGYDNRWFVASHSPITHIKIFALPSSGSVDDPMTGGEVYVFGR